MTKHLSELPRCMAERAVRARTLAASNPSAVDLDDEMLPWIYDESDGCWYSFDGNYSSSSPREKRVMAEKAKRKHLEYQERCDQQFAATLAWSKLRQHVLERDQHTCQLCGATAPTVLHVHHILKKREGGTDTTDNLITACPRCHRAADTTLYDPEWELQHRLPGKGGSR
jgi:5-methylcytosine-specific restriction endonuclease McrA